MKKSKEFIANEKLNFPPKTRSKKVIIVIIQSIIEKICPFLFRLQAFLISISHSLNFQQDRKRGGFKRESNIE